METHALSVWREYYRRRRIFGLSFLAFFSGIALAGITSAVLPDGFLKTVFAILLVAAALGSWVTLAWAHLQLMGFRCPRCAKRFAPYWAVVHNQCTHCGIKVGTEDFDSLTDEWGNPLNA